MSRDEDRDRFSRSGFAPLPNRHEDLPPASYDSLAPSTHEGGGYAGRRSFGASSDGYDRDRMMREREREDRIPPPREYPSHGQGGYGGGRGGGYGGRGEYGGQGARDRRDSWVARDGRDGRAPPPWEDDYDRPKRRRSPSPSYAAHRPRHRSPSPSYGSRPPYPPPSSTSGPGAGGPLPPSNSTPSRSSLPLPLPNHPDPASLEYLLPFRAFSEWFRLSHPTTAKADEEAYRLFRSGVADGSIDPTDPKYAKERIGMGKRYERYRKEYTGRQLYSLYLSHRDSAWFREKYGNGEKEKEGRKRMERMGKGREGRRYGKEVEEGRWDEVAYDWVEPSSSSAPGEISALDLPLSHRIGGGGAGIDEDDPTRIEVPPKPKQVFVKTVPPTIGRAELEAFFSQIKGFEYLALTEPSVKKSFHRVAWAQFGEGVDIAAAVGQLDGQKIDNFTLHMGANTAPTIGRLRLTHGIANTLPRLRRDAQLAKTLAQKLEEGFIKPEEEARSEDGDAAPAPADVAVKVEKDAAPAEGADKPSDMAVGEDKGQQNEVKKEEEEEQVDLAEEGWHAEHERPSIAIQARIDMLLGERGFNEDEGDLSHAHLVQKYKLTLDQWISYLRNGLQTCYYCVAPMGYPEELQRKCIGHMRSPAPAETSGGQGGDGTDDRADEERRRGEDREDREDRQDKEKPRDESQPESDAAGAKFEKDENGQPAEGDGDTEMKGQDEADGDEPENETGHETRPEGHADKQREVSGFHKTNEEKWEEGLERKLAPLLGEVDIADYYGKNIEDETRRLTAPYIKQEEASKYRCKECSKLFKAPEFVIKHVVTKHGELVGAQLDDYAVFNNFVLDPQHLSPTNTTPASVDDKLPLMTAGQGNMGMGMNMAMGNMGVPAFNPASLPGGAGGDGMQQQQQNQMMMMMMQMQQAMMMQMQNLGGGGGGGAGGGGGMRNGNGSNNGGGSTRLQDRMGGYANDNMAGSGRYNGSYAPNAIGNAAAGGTTGQGQAPRGAMGTQIGTPGKEDPRAKRGRVSYQDLDEVGGGEGGGLPY